MKRGKRPAFTLIELLVVILIIAVVIAIVVPALGAARRKSRKAITQGLVTNVVTSATSFQTDNRRAPGYYSARDMGSDENGGGLAGTNNGMGFSGMHNALIDLTGGPVFVGKRVPGGDTFDAARAVAPWRGANLHAQRGAETAWVVPATMGAGGAASKAYFTPSAKHFVVPRENRGTEIARFGTLDKALANDPGKRMPDLVDAFGTPILWWSEDETVSGPFDSPTKSSSPPRQAWLARISSDNTNKTAKFYWNSNAAHLKVTANGKNRADQVKSAQNQRNYSLIGGGMPAASVEESMSGLLGNPSFADGLAANAPYDSVAPSGGRGKFVLHAADPEGYYLGAGTNGYKYVKGIEGKEIIKFGYNYDLTKPAGREDVIGRFEDIIVTGGS